jgi:internalin A
MIGNRISDLTPLALLQVAELQEINLENNEITDVMALVGLQTLLLSNNSIVDLSALAGLTDLDDLGLSNNRIEDIGPLFGLSKLEYLGLSLNPKISCSDVDELATAIPDAEITAFDCTP